MNTATHSTGIRPGSGLPPPRARNFLVVDDDAAMRDMMEQLVAFLGYHPIIASNAEQALQKIAAGRIDLVISDIQMPGLSGLELLRILKEQQPDLPVLLMSGCVYDSVKKTLREYHADGFLPKPFNLEEFTRQIERVVK
jgi:two-component system, response regulator FlrC